MKDRFSKGRFLLVIETCIRQSALEFKHRGYGDIKEHTYATVEKLGPLAVRCYAEYNNKRGLKHFVETWRTQSDEFLFPERVGVSEDPE